MALDETTQAAQLAADSAPGSLTPALSGDDSADLECLAAIGQLSAGAASAPSLAAAVDAILATIEHCFAPQSAELIWGIPGEPRSFARGQQPIEPPTSATLDVLQSGQIATLASPRGQLRAWAPLTLRGQLAGWISLSGPARWSQRGQLILQVIAGHTTTALAMLDLTSRQDERLVQLETLALVGQQVSGVLDLDQILAALYSASRQIVDAHDFFVALYDDASATLETAYMVVDGEQRYIHDRWSTQSGLSAIVVRERQPISTDDYLAECARRGVAPYAIGGLPYSRAWLGIPLVSRDVVVGVMTITSRRVSFAFQPEHISLLMTIASQGAVAIANARLYQRSTQQARQLETLNRIGRTITSWLDFEQVPSAIMDQVTHLLGVEEGSLLLTDEATGDLFFAYTTGPFGTKLRGLRLPRGAGLAGYVATSGQSVIVNDVQRDGRFDSSTDLSTGYTTRRLMAVPLRGVSGIQGVIEVLNRRDNSPFSDADRQLLEALADYAVIALENARRFAQVDQALARRAQELARINDQLQHNLRSLTALNALGLAINTTLRSTDEIYRLTARGVVEITGALAAWVVRRQGGAWRPIVTVGAQLGEDAELSALFMRVVASGRPELTVTNLPAAVERAGARGMMVVPLRGARETLGCLAIAFSDQLPDASDRETIVLYATQAASAVERHELLSAISSARDQMSSILASTREGVMLIGPDGRIALTNARLSELCELEEADVAAGVPLDEFLARWAAAGGFVSDEWRALADGAATVLERSDSLRTGELNRERGRHRAIEWAAIAALGSGDSQGGALLVLRDISEAKENEKLRQDLTHMIVHDLRSPLSSVMASIEMLTRGISGELNQSQQHVLSIASDSSQQMLEMINTLLDISRLEAGRMPLTLGVVDVCATARRAAEQLASLAHERRITIETLCADALPYAAADAALVARVIQNLIANAIKFSGRGATISVGVATHPEGVIVSVRDRGIGIAPRDIEKLFTKFGQVGERRGGTGLGLTFCRLVVEAHAGRIWVESQPGEGSTFSFTLPALAVSDPEEEPAVSRERTFPLPPPTRAE